MPLAFTQEDFLVCNGINDCSTGTDEMNCICSTSLEKNESICKHNCNGTKENCRCSDYYFQCSTTSNLCIPYLFVCDGHKDCPQGEDEIFNSNINKDGNESLLTSSNKSFKCMMSGTLIPCPLLMISYLTVQALLMMKYNIITY